MNFLPMNILQNQFLNGNLTIGRYYLNYKLFQNLPEFFNKISKEYTIYIIKMLSVWLKSRDAQI